MRLVFCSVLAIHLVLLTGVSILARCPEGCSCSTYSECKTLRPGIAVVICNDGGVRKYCCPPASSSISRSVSVQFKKRLLPPERVCGLEKLSMRISEGQESTLAQHPWMALLSYKNNSRPDKRDHLCDGTLISKRYVLTAAHCVSNPRFGQLASVLLGEHDINTDPDCNSDGEDCSDPVLEVEVESIIAHENYSTPYFKNDIALLRLKTEVNFTPYIKPICLPFAFILTKERKNYTVAGWGKTDNDANSGSNKLMTAETTGIPLSECDRLQSTDVRPLDATQMCAGGNGVLGDTCPGDSGGPMLDWWVQRRGPRKRYQVGIVSFGSIVCGDMDVPTVYTRVDAFLPWILGKLEP